MAADFIVITYLNEYEYEMERRVRISDISGYEPADYTFSKTGYNALLDIGNKKVGIVETVEEIDLMLNRAKHSEAAIVSRSYPAEACMESHVYRYDEKEEGSDGTSDQSRR